MSTEDMIAEAAKKFASGFATMRELKGITKEEMEAVYSVGFNMYRTGRYDDAEKIFRFLVLFDHLEPKYWMGVGAIQQVRKDYRGAVASYGYASFLDLSNPKPQLHAAECFLALGDKPSAASALVALSICLCRPPITVPTPNITPARTISAITAKKTFRPFADFFVCVPAVEVVP